MAIISNKIKCKHCGDIIESTHVHDFKTCKCGTVSVDGGHEYLKRSFQSDNPYDDFEDLSITLKPCPFCGGEAELEDLFVKNKVYYVRCNNSSCPVHCFTKTSYEKEEAIEAWNRRASDDTEN